LLWSWIGHISGVATQIQPSASSCTPKQPERKWRGMAFKSLRAYADADDCA